MFGGSSKLGRGGKRNLRAPTVPRGGAPSSRISLGGRGGASTVATSSVEESFSLVRERPLSIGMAIKLPPDLVDEIRRVELGGGTAHIKFDANPNNPNGNIIQVGNKDFKFTRSREVAHLCDIYEERLNGEDGSGLLIESGGIWHKLNVERELDESTKNHVKRMSEEAERMQKSRRTIVLEHRNASSESQRKALAAAESNQKKVFKQRRDKEPPTKKAKYEAGGPPKYTFKSGISTTIPKGKTSSASPLSSGAPASPMGSGNLVMKELNVPNAAISQNTNKSIRSDKEMDNRLSNNSIRDKFKHGENMEAKPANLRSVMISLLTKHSSGGMSLKALEKAIGDSMPNSARPIEPILKQIANFQAPGRYLLKPGVETERSNEPPSQSGRSPETNHHQSPPSQKLDIFPAHDHTSSMRSAGADEEQIILNSTPTQAIEETIDIQNDSPQHYSEKKAPENTEGFRGSSNDGKSGSDSDSDSSASGSSNGSRSRSISHSPVGSGSDSDSESDASSSSNEASDEDVDIMTSRDENEAKLEVKLSDQVFPNSPFKGDYPDNEYVDIGNNENEVDHPSTVVEIEKDLFEDGHEAQTAPNYLYPPKVSATSRSSTINGRNSLLRRQQSEFQLGKVREPVSTGTFGSKKHLERSSFKERNLVDSDIPSSGLSHEIMAHFGKSSPATSGAAISGVRDRPSSRKARELHIDNLTGPHKKIVQHSHSEETHAQFSSQQNKIPETRGRSRDIEAGIVEGTSLESCGDIARKVSMNSIEQPQDRVRDFGHSPLKERKKQKSKMIRGSNDRRKDASLRGSEDGCQIKTDSSLDGLYSKFEKEVPELKGAVKNLTQYEEYVREYLEKYESYRSLNKILESYRNDFNKMGKDLEACRGSDPKKYNDILAQMRSSFLRCGERHKRLKRIYVVLHEELTHLKQMMKDFAASHNNRK